MSAGSKGNHRSRKQSERGTGLTVPRCVHVQGQDKEGANYAAAAPDYGATAVVVVRLG